MSVKAAAAFIGVRRETGAGGGRDREAGGERRDGIRRTDRGRGRRVGAIEGGPAVGGRSGQLTTSRGAPEALLPPCTTIREEDGTVGPLTGQRRRPIAEQVDAFARQGLRVLAAAERQLAVGSDRRRTVRRL